MRYRFGPETVQSEIALHGLRAAPSNGTAAIDIRRAAIARSTHVWPASGYREEPAPSGIRLRLWAAADGSRRIRYDYHADFAEFLISPDGSDIRVDASRQDTDHELSTLLEARVMGTAMRLRGNPCLHANALVANGKAIAIGGDSGAGKSSLTWALIQHGCRLLADDLVVVDPAASPLMVHPGRQRLRMWPTSAVRLSVGDQRSAPLYPIAAELEKLAVSDATMAADAPAPLHAIYRLAPRDPSLREAAFGELSQAARLATLDAMLYGAVEIDRDQRRRELAMLATLAERVPVRVLTLPDDLDGLMDLAGRLRARLFA